MVWCPEREASLFLRSKKSGRYEYLQLVHNTRDGSHVRQQVLATLGRLDQLRDSGQLDALIASLSRFSEVSAVLGPGSRAAREGAETVRIGPSLLFERLWQESGIVEVIEGLLRSRKFEFDVERAIFLTVLHRLFSPGSDRAAEYWRQGYRIAGTDSLDLHHLYRAMAWLGEPLEDKEQIDAAPFGPRTRKDAIEEALFHERRDLFSALDLVFFDTTSIYFEGAGGQSVGRLGHSKDHRPDRRQMVVGAVLDNAGRPICSELWPGNTTDVKTLLPVVDRLRSRFALEELCIVADRGMISAETIAELQHEDRGCHYILGARMRNVKEVRDIVLADAAPFQEIRGPRESREDPAPLQVKEVWVEERRYIVCFNPERARKDRADREAIVASLDEQLRRGPKSLVGNRGYRRYVKTAASSFEIDQDKIEDEARFDGLWVLRTDLDLEPAMVALKYKELWRVEDLFRSVKSVLATRPIYHKRDDTIRGHVFCSFLALMLLHELDRRMQAHGFPYEWARLREDLDALEEIRMDTLGRKVLLRTAPRGAAGRALQAAGVALGPPLRFLEDTTIRTD
jgi:hypothetical protein